MDKYSPDECFISINKRLVDQPELPKNSLAIDLRRNKLKKVSFPNENTIKYLDVSDNIISSLDELNNLHSVEILDVSYNVITKIPSMNLTSIKELYLIANDIKKLENIIFPTLLKLDVANNAIEKLENIDSVNLEELYLSTNHIGKVEDLTHLKNLRILDLQFNKLKELDCLKLPSSLEILLLQNNADLKSLDNIYNLKNLKMLGIKNTLLKVSKISNKIEIW